MDSLNLKLTLEDKIRERAHLEVVRSSGLRSTLVYPAIVLFLFLTQDLWLYSPMVETVGVALLASLASGVWRHYLGRQVLRSEASVPGLYRHYQGAVILNALVWASYACAMVHFCRQTTTGLLAVLSSLAIVAGSTSTLSPDLRLMRGYILIMILPPTLVSALEGGRPEKVTGIMVLAFTIFVWSTGKVHNQRFISWLRYNQLLDLRTQQLQESRAQAAEALTQETQARQEAEIANQTKGAFLATMSHEIRTPMNAIVTLADLLGESPLSEKQKDWVDTIKNGCDSLLSVISDVLDMAKIEAGRIDLHRSAFSPGHLCQELIRLLQAPALQKGLRLEFESEESDPVLADRHRLRQVLLNLLGNAIKFTPTGFVKLTLRRSEDYLDFSVIDSGLGLSDPEKLFKPFSQLDPSSTREYGGTGLGLAISFRMVELMQGWLWAESQGQVAGNPPPDWRSPQGQRQGSTFHFRIPAPIAQLDSAEVAAPLSTPSSPLDILIVEDNRVNQKVLRHLLERLGHQFHVAEDGLAALEALEKHPYQVILMDLQMPRLDGLETTRRIRAAHAAQPWIIAVTANAFEEDRVRCLAAGMNDYLSKPLRREALLRALEEVPRDESVVLS